MAKNNMSHPKDVNIGKKYGRLTVINVANKVNTQGRPYYVCKCDCGNTVEVCSSVLGRSVKSCGCLRKDIDEQRRNKKIGKRFGNLTLIGYSDKQDTQRRFNMILRCDCGRTVELTSPYAQREAYYCGDKNCPYKRPMKERPSEDLSGQIFGSLKVLRKTGRAYNHQTGIYECECLLCGNLCEVTGERIKEGKPENLHCGCIKRVYDNSTPSLKVAFGTNIGLIGSKKIYKNNTSGVKGVSYCNKQHRPGWYASCGFQGARINVMGRDFEDAVNIRNRLVEHRKKFMEWYNGLSEEEKQEKVAEYNDNKAYFKKLYKEQAYKYLKGAL